MYNAIVPVINIHGAIKAITMYFKHECIVGHIRTYVCMHIKCKCMARMYGNHLRMYVMTKSK